MSVVLDAARHEGALVVAPGLRASNGRAPHVVSDNELSVQALREIAAGFSWVLAIALALGGARLPSLLSAFSVAAWPATPSLLPRSVAPAAAAGPAVPPPLAPPPLRYQVLDSSMVVPSTLVSLRLREKLGRPAGKGLEHDTIKPCPTPSAP